MLSIIVSWRDRSELHKALPSLLESARLCSGEVVVVNYSGSRNALTNELGVSSGAVTLVEVLRQKYFNKSAAQNLGAFHAKHDILFFCDCDIILTPEGVREIVDEMRERGEIFATLRGVRESEINSRGGQHVVSFGYELHIKTADGRQLDIVDNEEDSETGLRQAPGLLFARRDHFKNVNGYNSDLHGWGWEDQDMIGRLTLGLGLKRLIKGDAVHISHGDDARIANYPPISSRWESRDRMFRKALSNYDSKNFKGTYSQDCESLLPEVIVISEAT